MIIVKFLNYIRLFIFFLGYIALLLVCTGADVRLKPLNKYHIAKEKIYEKLVY